MKKIIQLVVLLILGFIFNSCDEVEDLADVQFSTKLEEKIPVHFGVTQEYISKSIELDFDNEDTHDYLEKIKSIAIKKITYKFIDFTGSENCYMNVEISSNSDVFELKEFFIKQSFDSETVFEITNVDKLNAMAIRLKNNHKVDFKMEGETTGGEVDFKIEVKIELDIVANPL